MTDEQEQAEALDDDIIADDEQPPIDDDRFTEIAALDEDYPPDQPLGAEDPGIYGIEDDVATREERENPERRPT